ncbi:hypothetical protein AT1219_10413 [Vibrio alginolyticus]
MAQLNGGQVLLQFPHLIYTLNIYAFYFQLFRGPLKQGRHE